MPRRVPKTITIFKPVKMDTLEFFREERKRLRAWARKDCGRRTRDFARLDRVVFIPMREALQDEDVMAAFRVFHDNVDTGLREEMNQELWDALIEVM